MRPRLEAIATAAGRRRVNALLDAVATAELPPGLSAEQKEDSVIISGRGLARRLAFDARLSPSALIGRDE